MKSLPVLAALAVVLGAAAAPASASVRTALDEPLGGTPGTTSIPCQASWRPGTSGVTGTTVRVPEGVQHVEATLRGAAGDWDVAVFDASDTAVVASAEPDASESATGWTATGGELRVQVCRVTGDAAGVPVTVTTEEPAVDGSAVRADPPQLASVHTPTREAKQRVQALDLDLTEHGSAERLGVVLHGEADRAKLRKAGLEWDVLVEDLVAEGVRQRRAEGRATAAQQAGAVLPSGRTGTYRTLADYNAEMKALAQANPGLVRLFTMPNKTWLGKDVLGIEIAQDVEAKDGRPAFFNMGVHHAREWPAGEMPMEWAYELVNGFKKGDPRATAIVERSRNIVVPIVNPDGFEASRTAGELAGQSGGRDESVPDTAYLAAGAATGGEYRRKNCRLPDNSEGGNCATSFGLAEPGVDPNRNYGGLWGGPGADTNPATQSYRGPGPFSEPETRNVRHVVSTNQVTTLITNHTTAALVLRAPGLALLGDPVDENRGYKALGDAMAKENGYFSQKSFELYDTTGTTEDWSYNSTGGYGFTFELYCGDPNYETGDCDDPAFHPTFAAGVEKEWTGENPVADHTEDPAGAYDGKGNREAYYIAAESTIDTARHSVIEGTAPAGATLRLRKAFKTETFPQPPNDEPILFDDELETTYEVGSNGRYAWHVNPSTRPIVAKARGKEGAGEPSPSETTTGNPLTGSSETADDPDDGAAQPDAQNLPDPPTTNYNDHPFTIPTTGDNAALDIRVQWVSPTTDWDVMLYEDVNGNSRSDVGTDKEVGRSAQGATDFEQVSIGGDGLTPGKRYVLRVVNFAAVEPYDVIKTYEGFEPFKAAQVESWTLTCEVGGTVAQTEQVVVERGQRKTVDLAACARAAQDGGGGAGGPGGGSGGGACTPTLGFRTVRARSAGSSVGFAANRRDGVPGPSKITVTKKATSRRVMDGRIVRRFSARGSSVLWNGLDRRGRRVGDGYYVARFAVAASGRSDVRRIGLRRSGGRFQVLKRVERRSGCGRLRAFRLSAPVFGGQSKRPLKVAYRLGRAADVVVQVRRGGKVVRRIRRPDQPAGRTLRATVRPKGLRRGTYTVRLQARSGGKAAVAKAFSRRL